MNLVLAAMAQRLNGNPTYAWIIDRDAITDPGETGSAGVRGPSDAPEDLLQQLVADPEAGWTFRMYDDDGDLNLTGRLLTVEETPEDDETGPAGALAAPLYDFGEGSHGCTRITWDGREDWEIS